MPNGNIAIIATLYHLSMNLWVAGRTQSSAPMANGIFFHRFLGNECGGGDKKTLVVPALASPFLFWIIFFSLGVCVCLYVIVRDCVCVRLCVITHYIRFDFSKLSTSYKAFTQTHRHQALGIFSLRCCFLLLFLFVIVFKYCIVCTFFGRSWSMTLIRIYCFQFGRWRFPRIRCQRYTDR